MPKRIVFYSIGSHSAQLVLLYLQKLQHKFFNFIKWVSYTSSSDSTVGYLVLALSLSINYLLISISITNLMSNLKRTFIIELLWTQSRCHEGVLSSFYFST